MSSDARRGNVAAVAAVVATFSAGTTLGALRFVSAEIDPLTITVLRLVIGAAILLPLALAFARGWPRGHDLWIVLAFGILFFGISQWLVSASLAYTSAARGGILASTIPFMTLTMAASVRAERMTWLKLFGVTVATVGVVLALWQDASAIPGGWRGDLLMVAASVALSAYNVASRNIIRRYPPLIFVVCNMLPGAFILILISLAAGAPLFELQFSASGWLAILYIGTAGSAVTYFLLLWALRNTTPTRVAVALTMNPVGAIVAAAVVLDETITPGVWAGLACVVAGILLTNWRLPAETSPNPDPSDAR
ncbi:MAG: EamA family transporter [Alphaproteobacteria bacterium]|nr:EamA family transporter [Alphaproteobacteria bacterium]